jgi:hypothetical protein
VEFGPGKTFPELRFIDKLGLAETPISGKKRPTPERPRFLVVVFSAKDKAEALDLKVRRLLMHRVGQIPQAITEAVGEITLSGLIKL